jgi:hypothetical protein
MQRGGAYLVSDLPRDRLAGSLARTVAEPAHTLAARFGDMALPDVLIALTACEQRGDHSRTRGAGYVEPPRAAR